MTLTLHPQVETLVKLYARDLAQISPSADLDARIGELVAGPRPIRAIPRVRAPGTRWAAAAGLAALAIVIGVFIGAGLERRAQRQTIAGSTGDTSLTPADFSMWPADSVALQIPAEYSATGTLVAVDPGTRTTGKRYWIDVVVSNDGTMRIEKVVPADSSMNQKKGARDGITLQIP